MFAQSFILGVCESAVFFNKNIKKWVVDQSKRSITKRKEKT